MWYGRKTPLLIANLTTNLHTNIKLSTEELLATVVAIKRVPTTEVYHQHFSTHVLMYCSLQIIPRTTLCY